MKADMTTNRSTPTSALNRAARTRAARSARPSARAEVKAAAPKRHANLPGQVVLVLQGGGALGAYQFGVIEALLESGIEPAWVIGTSIGCFELRLR